MPGIGELDRYRNGYTLISGKANLGDTNLFNRIMECLGSREHDANFVVTEETLNWVKGQVSATRTQRATVRASLTLIAPSSS
jgi:hypothetical protein